MTEPQLTLPLDTPGASSPGTDPAAAPESCKTATESPAQEPGKPPEHSPPRLDRTIISVVVLREVDRALERYPRWAHPFAGLAFNRARRSFGQAHRDGRIVISTVFLGTSALDDLEDTVRHEIAHLIVGIDARHGPRWRRVARALGATPRATGRSSCDNLSERMDDAPYTLVAVLAGGEECEVKPVYRRSRSYLDYRLGAGGRHYRFKGVSVERFEYRRRRPAPNDASQGPVSP